MERTAGNSSLWDGWALCGNITHLNLVLLGGSPTLVPLSVRERNHGGGSGDPAPPHARGEPR